MNITDCILISVVFLCSLIGFCGGMLKQLCGLLGMAFSLFSGYLFYKKTGNLFLLPLVTIIAAAAFGVVVYLIKKIYFNLRKVRPEVSRSSRIAGGLIGGFKGVVLVLIVLICFPFFSGIIVKINPTMGRYFEDSFFYSWFKQCDLPLNIKATRNIHFIGKMMNENLEGNFSGNEEVVRELTKNPSFRAVLEDEELQYSIQKNDYKEIISSPKFRELLKDKDFLKQLYNIDYESVYKNGFKEEAR